MSQADLTVHDPITPEHVQERSPMPDQPRITTMDKKLVIEAAIPGWQPVRWWEERGVKNLPPRTIEAQVDAIEECVRAGASVIHTHPRHPGDGLPRLHAPELLMEIMDKALDRVDFITSHHTWGWDFKKSRAADYISYGKELLERGKAKGVGNRYVQSALIMTEGTWREDRPLHTVRSIREGVAWMEANGVKPMYSTQCHAFTELKRAVFDNGLAKSKPYWIAIQMGKHCDDQTFADPWTHIQVINNMQMIKEALPDAFIGIHASGRNWLPVVTQSLLLGCELVRVGLEDQFYLYPHRDDISHKASDTVELVARIARALGREIATVKEARERLGIVLG
ncbi:MAG: 3-keto-5-aminohexanoate cleavage protein [Chloroflexi bacterium]|nr:3-keto-5-aminohexanoate cleavage protein [Chloroflexota bacterium]